MAGEKFHFSQSFSFRGKTSLLLCTVIFFILDFTESIKNKGDRPAQSSVEC